MEHGISRDRIAAMAMQGILAGLPVGAIYDMEECAKIAVKHADALLRAISEGGEG